MVNRIKSPYTAGEEDFLQIESDYLSFKNMYGALLGEDPKPGEFSEFGSVNIDAVKLCRTRMDDHNLFSDGQKSELDRIIARMEAMLQDKQGIDLVL